MNKPNTDNLTVKPSGVPIPDTAHVWVINAQIEIERKVAKVADFRGSIRVKQDQRIDVLDVMCKGCRRPFEDVSDLACEAKVNNEHLIGGDQRYRAKRKVPKEPLGMVVPGPRINRRGTSAVLSREA